MRVFRDRWNAADDTTAIENAAGHTTAGAELRLPVDPTAIAQRFGAKVFNLPQGAPGGLVDDRHGELRVTDGRWQILVQKDVLNERRRFSIAHEIGHILLFDAVAEHPELVRELRKRTHLSYVEQTCNQIAARILMPTAAFVDTIERLGGLGADSVLDRLTDMFWVSPGAAVRRIVELDTRRRMIIWEYVRDHPRGPAWRTSKEQDRTRNPYIPDGMSSGRLRPDIVRDAADAGTASAEDVRFDAPSLKLLRNVHTYRQRERPSNALPVADFAVSRPAVTPRIYMVGEVPDRL